MTKQRYRILLEIGIILGAIILIVNWRKQPVWATESMTDRVVNVEDYGASGNDSFDDTAALQNSLNVAKGATSSVTVNVPSGTYYINKTLIIYSNTTLNLADDARIVRLNCANVMLRSEQDSSKGGYEQASNITVQGGVWDGNVTDTTVLSPLMYFCHASNICLENFSIKSACSRHMVIIAGVSNAQIRGVSFSEFVPFTGEDLNDEYYGIGENGSKEFGMRTMEALHLDCISLDGSSEPSALPWDGTVNNNIVVAQCTFDGLMTGVGNHYSKNPKTLGDSLTISDNTFTNLKYTCIDVYNQTDVIIEDNTATNCGELVRVMNSSGTIKNNSIDCSSIASESETALCGIKVLDSSGLSINGNIIQNAIKHGIFVSKMQGSINKNTVTSCTENGISVMEDSDINIEENILQGGVCGVYVESSEGNVNANQVKDFELHGIAIYDGQNCFGVNSNTIVNVRRNGVCINGTSASVVNNSVSSTVNNGIFILEGENVNIVDNTIDSAGKIGIGIEDSTNISVSGNILYKSQLYGICINGSFALVEKNTISEPVSHGIYVWEAAGVEVNLNKVEAAGKNGISIENSQTTMVNGNVLNDLKGHGIYVGNSMVTAENNEIEHAIGHGIAVYEKSICDSVSGNMIQQAGGYGICVNGSSAIMCDNTISISASHGIYALEGAEIQANHNTVSNAGANAILMNNVTGMVKYNVIIQPAKNGILVYSSIGSNDSKIKIIGNQISDAEEIGISVGLAENIVLEDNTILNSHKQGLSVYDSNIVDLSGNVVYDNMQHGILISNCTSAILKNNAAINNQTKDISVLANSTGKAIGSIIGNNGTWTYNEGAFPISGNKFGKMSEQKVQVFCGLVKGYDNEISYYTDGILDTEFEGMAEYDGAWWYVKGGSINVSYTGMYKDASKWKYISEGKFDVNYTGMAKNDYGWWYIHNGELDRTYSGLAQNDYGIWYMKNGMLDRSYTGMYKSSSGWVYIQNGMVDTDYTGLGENAYGTWYFCDGEIDWNYTGMYRSSAGWIYIQKGMVDTTYTGMAKNQYGWFYMTKGVLDRSYTGMAKNQYGWFYITNGVLDRSYTGMAKNQYGWFYMTNGALDRSYTGIAKNQYGWFYITNGVLDRSYSGMVEYNGKIYQVEKGVVYI